MDANTVRELALKYIDEQLERFKALRAELVPRTNGTKMTPEREEEVRAQILAGRGKRRKGDSIRLAREVFEEASEPMSTAEAYERAKAAGWRPYKAKDPEKAWRQVITRLSRAGAIRAVGHRRGTVGGKWEKVA